MSEKQVKGLMLFIMMFIFTLAMKTYWEADSITTDYEHNKEFIIDGQWSYLEAVFRGVHTQASIEGEILSKNISNDLDSLGDVDYLFKLLRDLDNIDNPIYTIFRENVEGYYFKNINNDANDPFIVILGEEPVIAADYSVNCSSDGRTRTFEEEFPMHSDRLLAETAFTRIKLKDVTGEDISDPITFQFVPHSDPEFKLTSWNLEGFKEYFLKSGGDWEKTFEAHEFIVPTYLYPTKDVSDIPIVNARGYRTDARVIVVNNVFNFTDVLATMGAEREDLNTFKKQQETLKKLYYHQLRYMYITGIMTLIIALLVIAGVIQVVDGEGAVKWKRSKTFSQKK